VRRRLPVPQWPGVTPSPLTQCTSRPHFEQFEGEVLKLAFEIGLHLEQLQPEHLGVRDEWIGATVPDRDRLIDEVVGLRRLLGDGVDGVLEDLALTAWHGQATWFPIVHRFGRSPIGGAPESIREQDYP
jgi:hypothetical protein